jgi:hypothetical protein
MILLLHHFVSSCSLQFAIGVSILFQITLLKAEMQKILEENAKTFSLETWKPTPDACKERARLTRREQRQDQYQQVLELHTRGLVQAEIAH